jgi:hypothetical protein
LENICVWFTFVSINDPENKQLLADTERFAFYYNASKLDHKEVESIPLEQLELALGPEEAKNNEERKNQMISKHRALMMQRHNEFLEIEAQQVC